VSSGWCLSSLTRSVSYRGQLDFGGFAQVGELAFPALQRGAGLLPGRKVVIDERGKAGHLLAQALVSIA